MLLRYPGGKSRGPLHRKLLETIRDRYTGGVFGELFLGGAGITLGLLARGWLGKKPTLLLNDLDEGVVSLWNEVISRPKELCQQIEKCKPSVHLFRECKQSLLDAEQVNIGFEFLVVNRMSHSGRGVLAGVQGGSNQTGKYKVDCRWNKDRLQKEVMWAHGLLKSATTVLGEVHCRDYKDLLPYADFLYLDPPYVGKGNQLYQHSFAEKDHRKLKAQLEKHNGWVLSYDNHPLVRELYNGYAAEVYSTCGNGGIKKDSELIICG